MQGYNLSDNVLIFKLQISSFFPACNLKIEPQRKKTYLRTCAPSDDLDQPAHSSKLIRIFPELILDSKIYLCFHAEDDCTNQAVRIRMLI